LPSEIAGDEQKWLLAVNFQPRAESINAYTLLSIELTITRPLSMAGAEAVPLVGKLQILEPVEALSA
jgi:hypothetical protein